MYGGVGGGSREAPSYPDKYRFWALLYLNNRNAHLVFWVFSPFLFPLFG